MSKKVRPQASTSSEVNPKDNYLVIGGYDNEHVMLSCFTRMNCLGKRGSATGVVVNETKDDMVKEFLSAGYKVFDRTIK